MRKRTKTTNGKGKFAKKAITPEISRDSRFLEIILILSERAWASAEQLIKNNSENDPRKTIHAMRHYKRAEQHARELLILSDQIGSHETQVEARAYYGWIAGNLAMRRNLHEEALSSFLRTYEYLQAFKEIGSISHKEYLTRLLSDIEPRLQFVESQPSWQPHTHTLSLPLLSFISLGTVTASLLSKMGRATCR